jgi:large subunit ribosomal protein L5
MGLPDQSIFSEIDFAKITMSQGMNITFVTSAKSDAEAKALLMGLGMPLRRTEEQEN